MKTTTFNLNRAGKCLSMLALLCCLLFNRAQAQYIPIDSGFALILSNNQTLASCINNYQLDTNCAKTYSQGLDLIAIQPPFPKSFEGLQYIGKNMVGQPVGNRMFRCLSMQGVTYMPDLPSIYKKVELVDADSLYNAPYPGDSALEYTIHGRGVHTLLNLPPKLRMLNVEESSVVSLPVLPSSLYQLYCFRTEISSLPTLPNGLYDLGIYESPLTSLPALPASLRIAMCDYTQLTSLPALPDSLISLSCEKNFISALPSLPSQLEALNCKKNLITALPILPPKLLSLACDSNFLTVLPLFPTTLQSLYCSANQLTYLPELAHTQLMSLYCSDNLIKTLPRLPDTNISWNEQGWDIDVHANNNLLDSITNFPGELGWLELNNNNLTTLPAFLGDTLEGLYLRDNNILNLSRIPRSVRWFAIDSNPIACLPPLPDTLSYLTYSYTNIACLPNIPLDVTTSLPVCAEDNDCYVAGIGGMAFVDKNENCVFDAGDFPLKNYTLRLFNQSYYTQTDSSGRYHFLVPPGNYQVSIPGFKQTAFNCTDSIINVNYNGIDIIDTLDIPISPDFYCAILNVDISTPRIRNNITNVHYAKVKNIGFDVAANTVLKVKFDPELIPLSSIPAWSQQLPGNVFVYNLGNILPQTTVNIVIRDSASINTIIGQTACVKAFATADGVCVTAHGAGWDSSNIEVTSSWEAGQDSVQFLISNIGNSMTGPSVYRIYEEELLMIEVPFELVSGSSLTIKTKANGHTYRVEADQRPGFPGLSRPRDFMELAGGPPQSLGMIIPIPQDDADAWVEIDCHEISGSFDPNAKEVYPAGVGVNHYITANDELEYILMFQNTGNDTAFNIKLIDTLDATRLDIGTFESGVSSHPYTLNMQGNGIVTWRFANIQLPDSFVNEPLSHGFVKFKIKQKQGNQPGAVINNFVDIYFDYNTPVRTNTAFVTIEEKDRIFSAIVEPRNIANGYTISVMPNPFADQATVNIASKHASSNSYTFELFDITGRTVQSKQVEGTFNINRDGLVSGMYLFKITENGKPVGNGKLIVK